MSLENKILDDYKNSMKSGDKLKVSVLSLLRSDFNYLRINKQIEKLEDTDIIGVIRKHVSQHKDSIEQFEKGARLELIDKEKKELEILVGYLPKELAEEDVKKLIEEAIVAIGAVGIKDMSKVMKEVIAKASGAADGKIVSQLVKDRLSKL
jgi:hypothetical protein